MLGPPELTDYLAEWAERFARAISAATHPASERLTAARTADAAVSAC